MTLPAPGRMVPGTDPGDIIIFNRWWFNISQHGFPFMIAQSYTTKEVIA